MNDLLNPRRFWWLLKFEYNQKGKSLLFSAGLIVGLMLLLMLPILGSSTYRDILSLLHLLAFFVAVIMGGSLFTNLSFLEYGSPLKGIAAVMIPASRTEKFLLALLINLIFAATFILLYWKLHHWLIDLANQNLSPESRWYQYTPPHVTVFLSYCYFLLQAVIFLGSIYFAKNSFVKTMGVFFVFGLVIYFFHFILVNSFSENATNIMTFPFTSWQIWKGKNYFIDLPQELEWVKWTILLSFILGLWYVAFVRLKEKEI